MTAGTPANDLRTVEDQLRIVLDAVRPVESIRVPLAEAFGRTLAEAATARIDIPAFDNSAMDGFAVRHEDVESASSDSPVRLRVVADIPAGSAIDPALAPGEAARIMTGSAIPTSADSIVPFEDTAGGLEGTIDEVVVLVAPGAGAYRRRRGADIETGDVVVAAGVRLGGYQVSACAAAGIAELVVTRAPRVAVISTGSELVEPGSPLGRGQIPDSNSLLLADLAADTGAEVVLRTSVADDVQALRAALAEASARGADVVVTSGGVSAGAYEVVKDTFGPGNRHGGEVEFARVAMQPGKPQAFGRLGNGMLVFGLPGNPVSVAVSFETFVRPALLTMQGRTDIVRPALRMTAAEGWRTPPGRRQYLPAAIDRSDPARWTVRPATAGGSGSHLAGGLGRAEALAVIPADVDQVAAGDMVDVMLLS
ncbi:gephyrin-like molybdotransferase Glp [Microbacterium rhizomatis]|uniref:Molybdopterin molybdenumtransferase n=1 Tax=Microbacterium rhizomatis TaxID=1631477 RepID=A0A5J5IZ48_9MICO|nr:gephyrin-like molybdotransferase Glp [Microbacterium rhizomatis]KAA9107641.1 molybdopterin molybdotransferase MoeA [Microbacterium rhizomatis]